MYYNNENTSQAFALSSPLRLALVRGFPEKIPGQLKLPDLNDILSNTTQYMMDQDINKLRKDWVKGFKIVDQKQGISRHCLACGQNYVQKNGELTFETTTQKARDTVPDHATANDKKP